MDALPVDSILLGDCLEVLKTLPDASVDAICTDPPYGLSDREPRLEDILAYLKGSPSLGPLKKGRQHCANSIVRTTVIPEAHDLESKAVQKLVSFKVTVHCGPFVAPGIIQLNDQVESGEKEIDSVGSIGQLDDILVDKGDSSALEHLNNSQFRLRERQSFAGCVEVCGCFTAIGPTLFRMVVGFVDDPSGDPQRTPLVMAKRATEVRAVLTLDVAGRTGELRLTDRASKEDGGLLLAPSENIRTRPGACGASTSLKSLLAGDIGSSANGAVTIDVILPTPLLDRFHSPVLPQKDFMGKDWQIPPVAVWKECYRVLKPGGHLASFAGTRTWDLISMGIRAAGFDNRDTIASHFGPLSMLSWIHCLSEDTEIFVNGKWEHYQDVKAGDKTLCFDLDQGAFAWMPVERVFTYDYQGDMIHLKGSYTDQLITPEHRCVVRSGDKYAFKLGLELGTTECVPVVPSCDVETAGYGALRAGDVVRDDQAEVSRVPYHGVVWCVKVPTGAFVARRNGKTFITGNSQGFPKSLNVFKQVVKIVEKALKLKGKTRWAHDLPDAPRVEVPEVLTVTLYDRPFKVQVHGTGETALYELPPELLRLKGYGTALKPSWEPILVFRKPVEGSVTSAAVELGTGVLNIDGARVRHANAADLASHKAMVDALKVKGGSLGNSWKNSSDLSGANEVSTEGRWPANIILMHSSECRQVGTRKVDAPVINRFDDGMKPFGEGAGHAYTSVQTGDADGKEEIPVYECADGCPLKMLDEQSGVTASGAMKREVPAYEGDSHTGFLRGRSGPSNQHGGKGGASRFFTQLVPDAPFFYAGKATRREKNEGVTDVASLTGKFLMLKEDLSDSAIEELSDAWEHFDPEQSFYPELDVPEEARKFFDEVKGDPGNVHPCLHPDALVLTDWGYRPISTIEVGDRVYTADGSFQRVEEVSRHPYTSPCLYEIHVMSTNLPVQASDNHPFLIWRPNRTAKGNILGGDVLWLRAEDIREGDYTMTPTLKESKGTDLPDDPDLWFVFGLYLAEGVLQGAGGNCVSKYPSFSLCADELDLIDRIKDFFGHEHVSVYDKPEGNGVQVMAFAPSYGALFEEWGGRHSDKKRLSPKLWDLPPHLRKAILDGWMAGDGGRVRQHDQGKTVSMSLAAHVRLLSESNGLRCRIYRTDPVEGAGIGDRKFKTVKACYQLDVTEAKGRSGPRWVEHEGIQYAIYFVKKVKKIPYAGDVWNLSVEGNPTFQTAVGMSHNTVKTLKLMEWLVKIMCPSGGIVLDPYCGSGTTCMAAITQRAHYVGIERDPIYHEIALKRVAHIRETKGSVISAQDTCAAFLDLE